MQKSIASYLIAYTLALAIFMPAGCAGGRHAIKAVSPGTEVVEAEGMAPIVNADVIGAKNTSLSEAMKNALGLVIGIYVSQEALVSKAVLIEDNITSQTEGYIEKYDVLKEWKEGDFYKTRIKALVRKEDLSEKLKSLDLEPKKLGNPVVKFSIEETIDGNSAGTHMAENELKKKFVDDGFVVSDGSEPDILVSGSAESTFNTDQGIGGLVSYRASIVVKVTKAASGDVITTSEQTQGGVDITRAAAAKTAIINGTKKIAQDLPATVLKFLKERSVMQLTISNVGDMNALNDFTRALRALVEVRDCRVRNYTNGCALLDMDVKRGTSQDIAKRLEQMSSARVRVNKINAYGLEAELVK